MISVHKVFLIVKRLGNFLSALLFKVIFFAGSCAGTMLLLSAFFERKKVSLTRTAALCSSLFYSTSE